jgi:hypothetical protein
MTNPVPRLAEILATIVRDPLRAEQIKAAADGYYERQEERRVGEYLVDERLISQRELAIALAMQAAIRGEYVQADLWMQDAERAADIDRRRSEVGLLHLRNLTMQLLGSKR